VPGAPAPGLPTQKKSLHADGWACWREDGHVYVGYVQAGPCCDPPAVSGLAEGEP
jgi:hypothetical protein